MADTADGQGAKGGPNALGSGKFSGMICCLISCFFREMEGRRKIGGMKTGFIATHPEADHIWMRV